MKILVAEDEFVSRMKLDRILKTLGHETKIAEDGFQAYDFFQADPPDIVITDWIMPKLDGLDLCKKIRRSEKGHHTYLILATAKSQEDEDLSQIQPFVDDIITKPYTKEILASLIEKAQR